MLTKKTNQPQHMGASYCPAHLVASGPTGIRRVLCTAGITALLACTMAPAAYADLTDDIPDSNWTPDVPSIDNTDPQPPVDPVDPGTGDDPGTGGDPGTGEDPGTGDDPGTGGDPGWTDPEIPDSGSDVPDYNYDPPSGGGSGAASEWAFYDPAEPPAEGEPDPNAEAPAAEVPAITVPVFVSYDAATRTLTGTAQPNVVVRIADAEGNPLVEDVATAQNGSFSVVLPEGVDVAGLSIFVVNENGEAASEPLTGATIVQEIARQELAQVRTAVGTSTTDLASGLVSAVGAMNLASSVEQAEEETMPPLPYILGAAAGVVAVGAVVGGIVAVRRRSAERDADEGPALVQSVVAMPVGTAQPSQAGDTDSTTASPFGTFVDLDETGSFGAVVSGEATGDPADVDDLPEFDEGRSYAPSAASSRRSYDDLDDIEQLAMNMHGAASDAQPAGAARSTHTHTARNVATGIDPDDDPLPPRGPDGGVPMSSAGDTAAFLVANAAFSQGAVPQPPYPGTGDAAGSMSRASSLAQGWEGDPAATLPTSCDNGPQDIETFRRTAYILATGTGAVHRITRSYENLDLSGLDAINNAPVSPAIAGDSFVADDDWYALALAELQSDSRAVVAPEREHAHLSTDDYVALVSTQRRESVPAEGATPAHTYVAPVVGPVALGHTDAVRRHAMLQESMTPAAIALRSRDEAFKSQRTYTFEAQGAATKQAARYEVPSITDVRPVESTPAPVAQPQPEPEPQPVSPAPVRSSVTAMFRRPSAVSDGVPVIARGTVGSTPGPMQRAVSVSDRVTVEKQSLSVPDPSAFAPVPMAPATPLIPQRGVAAAVAAAQSVYAAFAPVSSEPYAIPEIEVPAPALPTPELPVVEEEVTAAPEVVATSVAAAYAAAAYQNVHVPEHYLPPSFTAQIPPVSGHAMRVAAAIPAVEIEGDFSDPYSTETGYSAAYINYMVQDEFEHRHDTPAQRNAALGRMRIVNGAACAPVPLSESLRHRHPA